ncbi:MAG TPA: hypothetical protein ENJ15_03530 [Caldithrix abyssi]|uniref:Lipoprotein n=1 Tax=Caldithrix abyssi TaxID=187145 RepID=A0A7V5RNW9_CALAY|nr:hypothetical protein [Caldithrix abyssi]
MRAVWLRFFIAGAGLLALTSCGPKAKFVEKNYAPPEVTAILPAVNNSTDVEGGIVFRNLIYKHFEAAKPAYSILSREMTDSLLNEAGITDGGQLEAVENDELMKILNVDGLLFVTIEEMKYQTLGISSTRKVKANFKLLKGGRVIWEDDREVDHGKSALGTIVSAINDPVGTLQDSGEDLAWQLAAKGVKAWLLDHELKPEMLEVINTSFSTLP